MSTNLAELLATGPHRAHLCQVYDADAERIEASALFLRSGLERRSLCLFVGGRAEFDPVCARLANLGVRVGEALTEGSLRRLDPEDIYGTEERGDVASAVASWRSWAETSRSLGYAGIWAVANATWALGPRSELGAFREFERYERLATELLSLDGSSSALCQFRRDRFDDATLERVLHAHPQLLIGLDACENPYFDGRSGADGDSRFAWKLRHIRESLERERRLAERESEYRALSEHAPDAILRLDRAGRITYANVAVEAALGCAPDACLGRTVAELGVPVAFATRWRACSEAVLAGDAPAELDFEVEHGPDRRTIHWRFAPQRDGQGAIAAVLAVGRDLTELRSADQAKRSVELQLKRILEHAAELTYVLDEHARWVYASPSVIRALGYAESELIGRDGVSLIHPEDHAIAVSAFQDALLRPDISEDVEFRVRLKSGEYRLFSAHGVAVVDDTGRRTLVVNSLDVTDKRAAERASEEAKRFLESVLDSLGEAIVILDDGGRILSANESWRRAFSAAQTGAYHGIGADYLSDVVPLLVPDAEQARALAAGVRAVIAGGEPYAQDVDLEGAASGAWLVRATPFTGGGPVRVVISHEDLTAVRLRAGQQSAVAVLGQMALRGAPADAVVARAVQEVGRSLAVDAVAVGRWDAHAGHFTLHSSAGIEGWPIGSVIVRADESSQANRALGMDAPVIIDDVRTESRFRPSDFLHTQGYRSSIAVAIPTPSGAWGVLGAFTHRPHRFTSTDGDFLQGVANVVGAAIEKERTELQLRRSEERLDGIVHSARDAIIAFDAADRIVVFNAAAASMFDCAKDEAIGAPAARYVPASILERWKTEDRPRAALALTGMAERASGSAFPIEATIAPFMSAGEAMTVVVVRDVSEWRDLERQLFQAQKMEAIGRLAGGVAHDFNNLVTAITGFSELALGTLPPGDALRDDLEEIRRAGERAAALTRQLLAFSRRQVLSPEVIDLNEIVHGVQRMLQRLIGEHIELSLVLCDTAVAVEADRSQIEQVLMNLVVNARDAMPSGGRLTISTGYAEADDQYAHSHPDVGIGQYAALAVTDTGVGMDEQTRQRIFEPFFTTKPAGSGTGLGLSTVYGIVRQSGGGIGVYSEPGRGSTFRVLLPRAGADAKPADRPAPADGDVHGVGRILVVEDDRAVRATCRRMLESLGYEVLDSRDPESALELLDDPGCRVDLLLTDVVMPGISGVELARRVRALHPELRVLFMSGYPEHAVSQTDTLPADACFLDKPFTRLTLGRKVKEALGPAKVVPVRRTFSVA